MRNDTAFSHFYILILVCIAFLPAASQEYHPRLLVDSSRIQAAKSAILVAGSHHNLVFSALKKRVDEKIWLDFKPDSEGMGSNSLGYASIEAAFVYLLTGDTTYAMEAYRIGDKIFTGGYSVQPDEGYGLGRANTGVGIALAYDWCYEAWSSDQRSTMRRRIIDGLDSWLSFDHANLRSDDLVSNWVPVCRGGELIMMLACFEEQNRTSRYAKLLDWLEFHAATAYGTMGITQEGYGYTTYGGAMLQLSALALNDLGNTSLSNLLIQKNIWKFPLYAWSLRDSFQILQTGVSNVQEPLQGVESMLFNFISPEHRPIYKFAYDHAFGIESGINYEQTFGLLRASPVWSLLYYPALQSRNPSDLMPVAMKDTKYNIFCFRNKWADWSDIQVLYCSGGQTYGNAWGMPEAMKFNILAFGNSFSGGSGKETGSESMSCLLVDGQIGSGGGNCESDELWSDGGYIVSNTTAKFASKGIRSARRHFSIRMDSGSALISVYDTLMSSKNSRYEWQLNIGDSYGNRGIKVDIGTENGMPVFTLTGKNKGYLKGWVLSPTDAELKKGDPLRIVSWGHSARIWVAMKIMKDSLLSASREGSGMSSLFRCGTGRLRYDTFADRIESFNIVKPSLVYRISPDSVLNVEGKDGLLLWRYAYFFNESRAFLLSSPLHGKVDFAHNGSFSYTPDRGFIGEDGFKCMVQRPDTLSGIIDVWITIAPENPLIRNILQITPTIREGDTATFQASVWSPAGEALSFRWFNSDGEIFQNGTDSVIKVLPLFESSRTDSLVAVVSGRNGISSSRSIVYTVENVTLPPVILLPEGAEIRDSTMIAWGWSGDADPDLDGRTRAFSVEAYYDSTMDPSRLAEARYGISADSTLFCSLIPAERIPYGMSLWFRVAASDARGYHTGYGMPVRLSIPPRLPVHKYPEYLAVTAVVNQRGQDLVLDLSLPQTGESTSPPGIVPLNIVLCDIGGRRASPDHKSNHGPGNHHVRLNGTFRLNGGVYICRIMYGDHNISKRILLAR